MLCFAGWRSFWKFVSNLDRRETRRYLQMFYTLMMRPLIAKVLLRPIPVMSKKRLAVTSSQSLLGHLLGLTGDLTKAVFPGMSQLATVHLG